MGRKVASYAFPSPCGDYGSYQPEGGKHYEKIRNLFPSPCGDYGSYRDKPTLKKRGYLLVSVPLRGLWFLSYGRFDNMTRDEYVSVPLRGLWFLSARKKYKKVYDDEKVSVPLRGLWFLSLPTKKEKDNDIIVSVPLRGLWFLSAMALVAIMVLNLSFRPLAGIMVLIVYQIQVSNNLDQDVSVPLRGLWFLSVSSATTIALFTSVVSVPLRGLWFLSKTRYRRV